MIYMRVCPIMLLRYGTYVDSAAPLFSWPFLHQIVLPTLVDAQTGEHRLLSTVRHRQARSVLSTVYLCE